MVKNHHSQKSFLMRDCEGQKFLIASTFGVSGWITSGDVLYSQNSMELTWKKFSGWRTCCDYRALNSMTIPNDCPLSFLRDCKRILRGRKIYSSVDHVRTNQKILVHTADIPPKKKFSPQTFNKRNLRPL